MLFNLSSKNSTAIYPENVKKKQNIILQLNQWKLCVGYPQTVHDPSCCWQNKSCYSNILLVCWSWTETSDNDVGCFQWYQVCGIRVPPTMYQISLSLQSSICLCRENEISEPHWFIKQHVTSKSRFPGFLVVCGKSV